MKLSTAFLSLLSLVPPALAQSAEWGQCGGIGWSGATSCVSGTVCTVLNPYYSQCLPSTNAPPPPSSTAQPAPTTTQPAGTPTSTAGGGGSIPTTGLDAAAKAAGKKYFGTASDSSEFGSDAQYASILSTAGEFGALTPLNSMKWDTTEPSRGNFNFAPGDQLVAEAQKNGQIVRGHNCVWYNQLPSWVSNSGFNAATLTSVIQTHCSSLVSHFKGEMYYFLITGPLTSFSDAWDVINEPFNDDGTWRSDVFYNVLGTDYVQIALNAARAADPSAKLYINDYNIESTGAKATAMINLVKSLKSAGVPVDGVGFQGHFIVGEVPTSLQSVLQQVTALGVEVAITELDIRMPVPASAANLAQQQRDYQSVVAQCNAVAGCIGVTIWDFTDKYSWVPNTFSGQGAALPWDQNYQKKLAYTGAISGF